MTRRVVGHRSGAIRPLLSLGVLKIRVCSVGFLFRRSPRNAGTEAARLLAHYTVCLTGAFLPNHAGYDHPAITYRHLQAVALPLRRWQRRLAA